jgi:hypothetical protein
MYMVYVYTICIWYIVHVCSIWYRCMMVWYDCMIVMLYVIVV